MENLIDELNERLGSCETALSSGTPVDLRSANRTPDQQSMKLKMIIDDLKKKADKDDL